MCDDLVEGLNAKCVEDFANQKIVTPLIETLLTLNQGQGLGFQVFGVVVDKKMLFRIGSTLVGLLSTGLPIMFGLRQDMNEEFTHNTTDTTEGQLQLIREQMAALAQQLVALPALQEQMAVLQQQLAALPALQEQMVAQQQQLALLVNRTY